MHVRSVFAALLLPAVIVLAGGCGIPNLTGGENCCDTFAVRFEIENRPVNDRDGETELNRIDVGDGRTVSERYSYTWAGNSHPWFFRDYGSDPIPHEYCLQDDIVFRNVVTGETLGVVPAGTCLQDESTFTVPPPAD